MCESGCGKGRRLDPTDCTNSKYVVWKDPTPLSPTRCYLVGSKSLEFIKPNCSSLEKASESNSIFSFVRIKLVLNSRLELVEYTTIALCSFVSHVMDFHGNRLVRELFISFEFESKSIISHGGGWEHWDFFIGVKTENCRFACGQTRKPPQGESGKIFFHHH